MAHVAAHSGLAAKSLKLQVRCQCIPAMQANTGTRKHIVESIVPYAIYTPSADARLPLTLPHTL